jgi:hypothetical protein
MYHKQEKNYIFTTNVYKGWNMSSSSNIPSTPTKPEGFRTYFKMNGDSVINKLTADQR